jgi:serine/threonine protein kinase/Tfp pilus assembly protein PilF
MMTPERSQRVYAVFQEALQCDPAGRAALLDELCAGDPGLRAEVGRLLADGERASQDNFLMPPGVPLFPETALWASMDAPSQEEKPRHVGKRFGPYTLEERIAVGGMGEVYIAVHDLLGHGADVGAADPSGQPDTYPGERDRPSQKVIVKVIAPRLADTASGMIEQYFLQEIALLGRLNHVGIVRIFGGGIYTEPPEHGGSSFPYFAMEYVPGVPITIYKKEKAPELPTLLDKFLQACAAIRHAHDRGIIHCDLKPDHIQIDADGFPRVLDFGLARLLDRCTPFVVAGTLAYMSPEQLSDEFGEIGPRTDVYALGIILYELLAGRRPYEIPTESLVASRSAILEAKPTRLGEQDGKYRGELGDIVDKAIQRNPEERYQSVAAFEDAIRRYLKPHKPNNLRLPSIDALFKGREAFLDDMHNRLGIPDGRATIASRLALHGLGGVGKTRAALEYAWRHHDEYRALLFVSAATDVRSDLAGLVKELRITVEGTSVEQQLNAVFGWLADHPGWLLIIDAVDTEEAAREVERLLAQLRAGHVLITSRITNFSAAVEPLELGVLAPADAIAYLMEGAPRRRQTPDDDAQAAAIARVLDGLALALEQAAAYIQNELLSFAEYLRDWEAKRKEILLYHDERLMGYPESVATTWLMTFDRLPEPSRLLLGVLSWLAPEAIPLFLLEAKSLEGAIPEPRKALSALNHYSLTRFDASGEAILIHRLVQEVARGRNSETTPSPTLETAMLALNWTIASFQSGDARTWEVWTRIAAHVEATIRHADAAGLIMETAWLSYSIALYRRRRAEFRAAEALLRHALRLREQFYGPNHPQVAGTLNALAIVLHDTGQLVEAEALLRRAFAIYERTHGLHSHQVANVLNSLASLAMDTSRLDEAEIFYRKALESNGGCLGQDHHTVAISHNNLGLLLRKKGQLGEAETCFRRAIAIAEQGLGEDHEEIHNFHMNLALLLRATGRPVEAEQHHRLALAIIERRFDQDHPALASILNNLGWLLYEQKQFSEAEQHYRRALQIWERRRDPDHLDAWIALINLAILLYDTGRSVEAEPLFRRGLAIKEQRLGPEHSQVGKDLLTFANYLNATNRPVEAEPLFRRATTIAEKHPDPDHLNVVFALHYLAELLRNTTRSGEAEPFFRRVLEIRERNFGSDHPNVATALSYLACVLQGTGRPVEAEPLFRRAREIYERNLGSDHPNVATTLGSLALLLSDSDRPDEAERLFRRALSIDEGCHGPDHATLAIDLTNLGRLLRMNGRLDEAEPLIRRALALWDQDQNTGTKRHYWAIPNEAMALGNLALILKATDRLDEAKRLSRRAVQILDEFQLITTYEHPSYGNHLEILRALGED